jgi:hypothetical protein
MAEPLKTFFSSALVRRLAADIERVHPSFPSRSFVGDATKGLETLELLDRGKHITRALERHLPASYPEAIDILLRSLGPEHATDELIEGGSGKDRGRRAGPTASDPYAYPKIHPV